MKDTRTSSKSEFLQLGTTEPVTITGAMCTNPDQPLQTPTYACGDNGGDKPNGSQTVVPAAIVAIVSVLAAMLV